MPAGLGRTCGAVAAAAAGRACGCARGGRRVRQMPPPAAARRRPQGTPAAHAPMCQIHIVIAMLVHAATLCSMVVPRLEAKGATTRRGGEAGDGVPQQRGAGEAALGHRQLAAELGRLQVPRCPAPMIDGFCWLSALSAVRCACRQPTSSLWGPSTVHSCGSRWNMSIGAGRARELQVRGAADPLHLRRHRRHDHHAAVLDVHLHLQLVLSGAAAAQLCNTTSVRSGAGTAQRITTETTARPIPCHGLW